MKNYQIYIKLFFLVPIILLLFIIRIFKDFRINKIISHKIGHMTFPIEIYICEKNGIDCFQRDFTFNEIKNCDEAFVTGTFAGIIPVSRIENKDLLSTQSNSLTNHIRALYNEFIHKNINQL